MARNLKLKHKKKTPAQLNNVRRAIEARWKVKGLDSDVGDGSEERKVQLEAQLEDHKLNYILYKNKYWNAHRKNYRQKKAYEAKKIDHNRIKEEAYRMRGALVMLGKELEEVKTGHKESLRLLNERIKKLEAAKKDLQHERTILRKRNKRINAALNKLNKRVRDKKLHSTLRLTQKGVYTIQARALARLMVSTGTAEAKVGETLQEIGKSLGVDIPEKMSKRTIQRSILEVGVAADIQLGYEMAKTDSKNFIMIMQNSGTHTIH